MKTTERLIRDNTELLRQGLGVLEKLPDELYVRPEPRVDASGVGVHLRHIIDFYACLLRDLESGRIDFDRRERDPRLETERDYAAQRLRELVSALPTLAQCSANTALSVRIDADREDAPWCSSSLGRELRALLSHTIHHFSLVRMILQLNGETVPENFGVAPSTLRYHDDSRGPK
jgi:hypothetical protein